MSQLSRLNPTLKPTRPAPTAQSVPKHRHFVCTVTEGGAGTDIPPNRKTFCIEPGQSLLVACGHDDCLYGGVELGGILNEMTQMEEREYRRLAVCEGVRTGGNHTANFVRCHHMFSIHLKEN